ncbi:MAG: signal peptidase II [Oligoflexia bacterium]|nr:signal peptidase II [Oligoflexia bacterium]
MVRYAVLFVIVLAVVGLDQSTKWLVLRDFRLHETLPLIEGFFNLTYIRNTGAAFGLLANLDASVRVPFFVVFPLVALAVIGYIFRKLQETDFKLSVALSLVMGGALGNLIDRARFGYVVDFLDFHWNYRYHFPAFNVADSAICVGVAIMLLDTALRPERATEELKEENAPASS